MRRITKKLVTFFFGVVFTGFFCEHLIYYLVVAQCGWPALRESDDKEILKAFILADTHLLGPWKGHWLDKWRREFQMQQAFQAIVALHKPDVVFVLGDLFDEGEWTNDEQFQEYVDRFKTLFALPKEIKMHVMAGNHDIGFHNYIWPGTTQRFTKLLKAPPVKFISIKDNHFVIINSMAMENDRCRLCTEARTKIEKISETLNCWENSSHCRNSIVLRNYSRPILLQHFPLYRLSDAICTEPDAPPLPERNKRFRLKIDALAPDATQYLVEKIKPRVVFGGHTHHGCLVHHSYDEPKIEFDEHSVPSFSWRNRPDPKFMLVSITPDAHAVNKCGLPRETTIAISAVVLIFLVSWYTFRRRSIGR